MKVFLTARGLYQVQDSKGYALEQFGSLLQANAFVRGKGFAPEYTWFNQEGKGVRLMSINESKYTVNSEKEIDYNLFAGIQSVIRVNDVITGNDGQKYRITAKTQGKLLAVIICR